MKICHGCGGEYEDFVEMCADCGALLVDSDELAEQETGIDIIIENPVLAANVEDIITAEIFCDVLKENDILYTTDHQDSETVVKVLFGGSFAGTNIYVDEGNLEKAQELYEQVWNRSLHLKILMVLKNLRKRIKCL